MVKHEKEKLNLVLFLTLGGSLKQWHKAGILDRELALYRELNEKYNVSTSIISLRQNRKTNYKKLFIHQNLLQ